MTPFGQLLEKLRRSRQLQQKQLAVDLGIQASYVSSLEKGRKSPPSKKILERLIDTLELNESEQAELWESVKQSQMTFELPNNMVLSEYQLVSRLREKLGSLTEEQINLMMGILALNVANNRQTNPRRINM